MSDPRANSPQPKIPIWGSIRRLLRLSGRQQAWLYLAMLMAVLSTGFTIAWNLALKAFIDAVSAGLFDTYMRNLWLALAFFLVAVPLQFLQTWGIGRFSERTMAGLREKIATRATLLPMSYLEERHSGDLLGVMNSDLARLQTLVSTTLIGVVAQSLMAAAALVTLFFISWPLALVSTLLTPLMFAFISRLNQPVAQRTQEMQQAIGETLGIAEDGLGGLMVTRAFNLAGVMEDRFRQVNQRALHKGLALIRLRTATDGIGAVFEVLPFLITFGFGGYLAISGQISFGSLLAFINLLNFVAGPLGALPPLIAGIGEASGAAQRTYQILDQEIERQGGRSFPMVAAGEAAVRFAQLNFSYGEERVLEEVSLTVPQGQTTAVVGPSGGGKSTLLKLLLGFYPAAERSVFLYGHDLNEWSLASAREQMAFVAQDTYLFPVSIAENIACGKPGAGQAEIERAARMANIHDDIAGMPDGYRTLTGERGTRLSGGQRQRISLARAILKNAPILLLDEPTSALDTESEALVQDALERFMVGRTTIVIAHRLSTIRRAERVLVLEGGRIIEEGTHEELLAREGRYKDLYLRQFGGNDLTAEQGKA